MKPNQQAVNIVLFPYSAVVGQQDLKLALELAYLEPKIQGVLISGHRGCGKSTAVRAFAHMMYGKLPVTLPINATEDRVVGGWRIDALMQSKAERKPGLLEEADGTILYIDEVNLLDNHIVDLILDVAASNILVIQHEQQDEKKQELSFTLVGTMNPEEGNLRPQLRDRFGLMVDVATEFSPDTRRKILANVLEFDRAKRGLAAGRTSRFLQRCAQKNGEHKARILAAEDRLSSIRFDDAVLPACIEVASHFQAQGYRSDYVMALAARGCAALAGDDTVTVAHLLQVAPMALQHRLESVGPEDKPHWTADDTADLCDFLGLTQEERNEIAQRRAAAFQEDIVVADADDDREGASAA